MTAIQVVFVVIAAITLVGAFLVVVGRNLIHAALWLILALAGVAALLVVLEAGLLAAAQVAIYIGGIAILIIFAVMLTRRVMTESGPQTNRNWWVAALAAVLVLAGLVVLLTQTPSIAAAQLTPLMVDSETLVEDLGRSLVDVDRYVVPFEVASILLVAAMIGAIVVARPSEPPESEEAAG